MVGHDVGAEKSGVAWVAGGRNSTDRAGKLCGGHELERCKNSCLSTIHLRHVRDVVDSAAAISIRSTEESNVPSDSTSGDPVCAPNATRRGSSLLKLEFSPLEIGGQTVDPRGQTGLLNILLPEVASAHYQ